MTFGVRPKREPHANGVVWPDTGTDVPVAIRDIFGGRPFAAHIPTVGYDYDMHRGVDIPLVVGDTYLSPVTGRINRLNRSHFPFTTTRYQSYWQATASGFGGSWVHAAPGLTLTGTRGGTNSFPTTENFQAHRQGIDMTAGQWEFRVKMTDAQGAINGAFGIGVADTLTSQYAVMEWDGTNVRCMGSSSSGALANHNTTAAVTSGHRWLRVRSNGTTLQLATSSDGDAWTNKFTETNPTWTNGDAPSWRATLYYRSKDTHGTPDVINIVSAGWYDSNGIGRFGNWFSVARAADKFAALHFDDLLVEQGDIVAAGQAVGTVGLTGFDDRSGPVLSAHVHIEWTPNANSSYANDDAQNPLKAGIMPRTNVSNNVSVVRTTANDPDGLDSYKLVVTCTRQAQDFDMNEFSLTGNTNTRSFNWDTRANLNADNDIPKNAGIYIVASSFDEDSASYVVTIYFNKATVGNTFVSAFVKDCNGVTLWSE